MPDIEVDRPKRQRFKRYPIGFCHIAIAEVQAAEATGRRFLHERHDQPRTRLADFIGAYNFGRRLRLRLKTLNGLSP